MSLNHSARSTKIRHFLTGCYLRSPQPCAPYSSFGSYLEGMQRAARALTRRTEARRVCAPEACEMGHHVLDSATPAPSAAHSSFGTY
jgi:hypothetical protein